MNNDDMRLSKSAARGFTLIEIMIVVVILGVLAALVIPKLFSRPDQAKGTAATSDIRAISNALELYRMDNGDYPTTDQGLEALVQKPTEEPIPKSWDEEGYLKSVPIDPWKRPYYYLRPGLHGAYDLFSYGANGVDGGTGKNANITNWSDKEEEKTKAPRGLADGG